MCGVQCGTKNFPPPGLVAQARPGLPELICAATFMAPRVALITPPGNQISRRSSWWPGKSPTRPRGCHGELVESSWWHQSLLGHVSILAHNDQQVILLSVPRSQQVILLSVPGISWSSCYHSVPGISKPSCYLYQVSADPSCYLCQASADHVFCARYQRVILLSVPDISRSSCYLCQVSSGHLVICARSLQVILLSLCQVSAGHLAICARSLQVILLSLCQASAGHLVICARWTTRIVLPLKSEMQHTVEAQALPARFHDVHPSLLLFLHRLRHLTVVNKVATLSQKKDDLTIA